MVRLSTVAILVGIGLIFVPLPPPIGIVFGAIVILGGIALRVLAGK